MLRSNSKFPVLATFGLAVLLASAGCSSLDHTALQELELAESTLETNPAGSLATFDRLLQRTPDDPRLLIGRATALEQLGRVVEARDEWTNLLGLTEEGDEEQTLLCHRGIGRCILLILGSLPSAYTPASSGRINVLEAGARSFQVVLDSGRDDEFALFGLAHCQFAMGRLATAKQTVDRLFALDPEHEFGRFLDLQIRQELVGRSPSWIRELTGFLSSDDPSVQVATARELIRLGRRVDLTARVKVEVDASIDRIRNLDDLPNEIATALAKYESEQTERKNQREAKRLLATARRARVDREWKLGWDSLLEAEKLDPNMKPEKKTFANAWANALADRVIADIKGQRVSLAQGELESLRKVPTEFLNPTVTQRIQEVEQQFATAWTQYRIDDRMTTARENLRTGQAVAALEILDGLRDEIPTSRRVEFDLLLAEALADNDRVDDAIDILDNLKKVGALNEFRDTEVFRVYGVLLSRVGRSEEAQLILEELPLHLFDSRAFDALISSLEQQGQWETVLARLQSLTSVPEKYRPTLVRCAAEAARRRLRGSDPDAAKRLLDAYLKADDYDDPLVQDIYLQILVETDHFEEASELILNANEAMLAKLPVKLLGMVRERAEEKLSPQEKFNLFVRLMAHDDDEELARTVKEMQPLYGSYYPKPGDYVASYQLRNISGRSTEDLEPGEMKIHWNLDHFEVESPSGSESWRFADGVWVRQTSGAEMRIPCRASERPPHPVEQFQWNGQLWSAQVVEVGVRVTSAGRVHSNCLKVQVINEANQNQYHYEYLAPNMGLVLREEFRFGEVTLQWELKSLRPKITVKD